jgi:hypothetical protein
MGVHHHIRVASSIAHAGKTGLMTVRFFAPGMPACEHEKDADDRRDPHNPGPDGSAFATGQTDVFYC